TSFINGNNLPSANIVILLSETVLFEKDILDPENKDGTSTQLQEFREKGIKDFIDTVPFENVITHTYVLENGIKIVATNNDLQTSIKYAFEQKGSRIFSVIPAVLLGDAITNGLTPETLQTVASQLETIKSQSLLQVYQNIVEGS